MYKNNNNSVLTNLEQKLNPYVLKTLILCFNARRMWKFKLALLLHNVMQHCNMFQVYTYMKLYKI